MSFLLDSELRFVDCNPVWDEVCRRKWRSRYIRTQMIGKSILDFIPDVLRTFYVQKFWLASRSPGWTELDYHCSSPEKIRLFRMAMMSVAQELLVVNHLLLEEACEVRPALTATEKDQYRSPEGFVTMCANCRKTKHRDDATRWDWIPEFLQDQGFQVSHGLCPRCVAHLYG